MYVSRIYKFLERLFNDTTYCFSKRLRLDYYCFFNLLLSGFCSKASKTTASRIQIILLLLYIGTTKTMESLFKRFNKKKVVYIYV